MALQNPQLPLLVARVGGYPSTHWNTWGITNYNVKPTYRVQCGVWNIGAIPAGVGGVQGGTGPNGEILFPVPYSVKPFMLGCADSDDLDGAMIAYPGSLLPTGFAIYFYNVGTHSCVSKFFWLAIGPA